jgi:hypothetical protein
MMINKRPAADKEGVMGGHIKNGGASHFGCCFIRQASESGGVNISQPTTNNKTNKWAYGPS